jgi:hypothetical protein
LIATLPVGYADGYCRRLSNRAEVLVRGRRVKVAGVVCMDLTMIDVSDIPGVQVGDEVILLGKQGSEEIQVFELARWAETISYEDFCGIGQAGAPPFCARTLISLKNENCQVQNANFGKEFLNFSFCNLIFAICNNISAF